MNCWCFFQGPNVDTIYRNACNQQWNGYVTSSSPYIGLCIVLCRGAFAVLAVLGPIVPATPFAAHTRRLCSNLVETQGAIVYYVDVMRFVQCRAIYQTPRLPELAAPHIWLV